LLSGCFATSALVGVREPDVTRIERATQRAEVEQLLGKPLWQPGVHKGLTYEVYQYKAAKPPQLLTGTVALGMDYFTLGMFEFNMMDVKHFAPVKQVAVAYKDQDLVRSVSSPWPVETAEPCRRMRSRIPKEVSGPANARPVAMFHGGPSNAKLATLKWKRYIQLAVDGRALDGTMAELPPGRHKLDYSSSMGGSIMYGAMVLSYDQSFGQVELLAGRTYQMKHKRFYPGLGSRVDIFWLEDIGNRETLACSCD
jgi:hypothetical protein